MPSLIITVGIPGCGKSTLARQLKALGNVDIVISSDSIRDELTGDPENQEQNANVFRVLNHRVAEALSQGLNVLVDATNLKPSYRNGLKALTLLARVRNVQGPIECRAIRFADSADFDLCQKRNTSRERVVPEFVMQRFHAMFLQNCSVEQLRSEGWIVEDLEDDRVV